MSVKSNNVIKAVFECWFRVLPHKFTSTEKSSYIYNAAKYDALALKNYIFTSQFIDAYHRWININDDIKADDIGFYTPTSKDSYTPNGRIMCERIIDVQNALKNDDEYFMEDIKCFGEDDLKYLVMPIFKTVIGPFLHLTFSTTLNAEEFKELRENAINDDLIHKGEKWRKINLIEKTVERCVLNKNVFEEFGESSFNINDKGLVKLSYFRVNNARYYSLFKTFTNKAERKNDENIMKEKNALNNSLEKDVLNNSLEKDLGNNSLEKDEEK